MIFMKGDRRVTLLAVTPEIVKPRILGSCRIRTLKGMFFFFGAFAKLRKATVSFAVLLSLTVRQSVSLDRTARLPQDEFL